MVASTRAEMSGVRSTDARPIAWRSMGMGPAGSTKKDVLKFITCALIRHLRGIPSVQAARVYSAKANGIQVRDELCPHHQPLVAMFRVCSHDTIAARVPY